MNHPGAPDNLRPSSRGHATLVRSNVVGSIEASSWQMTTEPEEQPRRPMAAAEGLARGSTAGSAGGSVRGSVLERSPHFCAGVLVSTDEEGSAGSADSLGK